MSYQIQSVGHDSYINPHVHLGWHNKCPFRILLYIYTKLFIYVCVVGLCLLTICSVSYALLFIDIYAQIENKIIVEIIEPDFE